MRATTRLCPDRSRRRVSDLRTFAGIRCRTRDSTIGECLDRLAAGPFDRVCGDRALTVDWQRTDESPSLPSSSERQWDLVRGGIYDGRPVFWTSPRAVCSVIAPDRVTVFGDPTPDDPS